jgi:N-acetylglucosamine malate deacetylase 1
MKVDILAFGVHPDDVELSCSGTLLCHIDLGYTVGLCDLSRGELGTRGNAELRMQEAEKARSMLGASFRLNLDMADGFFTHDKEHILKIVRVIRKYKPEIVLANAISDRHPDHGRAAKLVADACFYSGLIKIESSDDEGHMQDAWRPSAVYHYIQDRNLRADFVVDIGKYMDKKLDVIMAFRSQFYSPESDEPETPISKRDFLDFVKSKNKTYARDAGFEYAEAFNTGRNIGVANLFDLK